MISKCVTIQTPFNLWTDHNQACRLFAHWELALVSFPDYSWNKTKLPRTESWELIDMEQSYPKAKRIILRDVLRTDRNFHYFT